MAKKPQEPDNQQEPDAPDVPDAPDSTEPTGETMPESATLDAPETETSTKPKSKKLSTEQLAEIGFKQETVETAVGENKYSLTYHIAPDSAEGFGVWQRYCQAAGLNFEEFVAKNLNEIQTQRAAQGGKTAVRDAENEADREKAVTKHQKQALAFVLGKPRERAVGGVTKKVQGDLGAAIVAFTVAKGGLPSAEELAQIAKELGVDTALLTSSGPSATAENAAA